MLRLLLTSIRMHASVYHSLPPKRRLHSLPNYRKVSKLVTVHQHGNMARVWARCLRNATPGLIGRLTISVKLAVLILRLIIRIDSPQLCLLSQLAPCLDQMISRVGLMSRFGNHSRRPRIFNPRYLLSPWKRSNSIYRIQANWHTKARTIANESHRPC